MESPTYYISIPISPLPEEGIDVIYSLPSSPRTTPVKQYLTDRTFRYLARPISPEHEINLSKLEDFAEECKRTHELAYQHQDPTGVPQAHQPYPVLCHGQILPPSLQPDPNSELVAVEFIFPPTVRTLRHGVRAVEVDLYPDPVDFYGNQIPQPEPTC